MFTRLWKIGNTTLFDRQFVGDGMLAFFNAPHAVSDHAAQAWEAAQAAQHSLDHFNQATEMHRRSRRASVWRQGEVVVGNIGTARHLSPYKREQVVGQVRCWASLGSLVLAFLIF